MPSPPLRHIRIADVLALVLIVAATVVWSDAQGWGAATLTGVTVVLVTWPALFIGMALARWWRQRDWRYVGIGTTLFVIATASAAIGILLTG